MILITGANGFLGCAIVKALRQKDISVRGAVRKPGKGLHAVVGDIGPNTDWNSALNNVDIVIHTAAWVHRKHVSAKNTLREIRKTNVDGTLHLARQAVNSNVKRFIFVSTIKVNGESTLPGKPFTATSRTDPMDPYAMSKLDAEIGLRELSKESGMEIVIIRPPLVYGPGVKGNFLSIMRWISRGLPLPLGAINNRRSLVFVDNLVDLIATCIEHPAAANQTFLAGDGEDLSTVELSREIGEALGRPARIFPVPVFLLTTMAFLLGKVEAARRLCGNLQVDISKARDLLEWEPPCSVDEGLRKTAEDFKRIMTSE